MINIAIDGPAGAGKSTIARTLAADLGYIYVDTGALYRAVGVNAMRRGADAKNAEQVTATLPSADVSLRFVDGEQRVYLGEEDVSLAIRTPEASMAASNVSAIPAVRDFLLDLQRSIAAGNNCIMDGRDIGTVILPNAQVKIFLTASVEVRAKRRYDELLGKGMQADYETVLDEMIRRDEQDMNRAIAPLRQAPDAVAVDTSEMDLEQVLNTIKRIVKEKQ